MIRSATDCTRPALKPLLIFAKYFITCHELTSTYSIPIIGINEMHPERLRPLLVSKAQQKRAAEEQQLKLDFGE